MLRVAYQKFPSGDLVVKNQKLLEKALPGWDIQWKAFDSGASINTAFIAKAVDVGAIGSSPVARGLSQPLNIPYSVAYVLDVAGENEALVARKATGVSAIEGLKGKRIATPFASTSHYSLLAALDHAGLKESDVKLVDLQPQDILAAWQRGDIDAAYVWLPVLDELQQTAPARLQRGRRHLGQGHAGPRRGGQRADHGTPRGGRRVAHSGSRRHRSHPQRPGRRSQGRCSRAHTTPEDAASQLKQGVFLTPEELTSPTWLGSDGAPGGVPRTCTTPRRS